MPIIFTFPNGSKNQSPSCDSNLNILAHAQFEEIDLGSRCGGHGICGADRVRILSSDFPLSPVTDEEKLHLSDEEIASGVRLACQCFPEKDGTLEVRAYPDE